MISIAMTTYNGAQFLVDQLDSILKQTMKDWELIVCDDCSKDETVSILKRYSEYDNRIKVYVNTTNLGFKNNFQKAMSLCTGEYIALSDQDDIWEENHLEVLYRNIQGKSAATGNASIIDSHNKLMPYILSEGDKYFVSGNEIDKLFTILCYRNPFFGAISMYKAGKFLETVFPIPDFVKFHDTWFSIVACCMEGLNYTNELLLKHRIHGNNESGTHRISFVKQIASLIRSKERSNFCLTSIKMCDEVLLRIPYMSEEKRETINIIKELCINKLNRKKMRTIFFTVKFYKKIYSTNNYRQVFLRCIGLLLQI